MQRGKAFLEEVIELNYIKSGKLSGCRVKAM